ncbi:MAG TPA: type VII secretion protein EccE [Propionibacteriaceae bacterium]|nr:type VII secretion protein EccE [Propionibacteriaceae bacterium]HQE31753.1 type VII secretion protein EccE [Propionibacteriaceae bacterium]
MARSDQARRAPRSSWLRRHFGKALAIEAALLGIALLVIGRQYVVAGVVAVLALLLLVPMKGHTLPGWIGQWVRFARRKPSTKVRDDVPMDLVPLAEWVPGLSVSQTTAGRTGELGVIADGQAWTAVLALVSDDDLLADKGEKIDLDGLSGLTVQDDIVFAGVQVVTYTVPAPTTVLLGGDSRAAKAYLEISKEPPPPTMRRTWLCLRLDPRLCLEAVALRGANHDGIYGTLRFGLHRVQSALKRQGIETRALSPIEIYEVLSLTSGSGPEGGQQRSQERWSTWACDGLVHSGRMVRRWGKNASIGYQSLQQAVGQAPVLFAITSYTLTPTRRASGGIRLVTPNAESGQAAVAFIEASLSGEVTFGSPSGDQVPTMLATVPLGRGVR